MTIQARYRRVRGPHNPSLRTVTRQHQPRWQQIAGEVFGG
jgi:hypothetical protein